MIYPLGETKVVDINGTDVNYDMINITSVMPIIDLSNGEIRNITITYVIAGRGFIKTIERADLPNIIISNNTVDSSTVEAVVSILVSGL